MLSCIILHAEQNYDLKLNLPYFISKRISGARRKSFSSTIHKIAIFSIGIGLGVLIISFLILKGYENTVTEKIFSFSGHFQVTKFSYGSSYEEPPMNTDTEFYRDYSNLGYISHVQEYAHKAGLIKTEEEVLGVVIKGVGRSFDTAKLAEFIVEGEFLDFPETGYANEIILSRRIADKLNLSTGDETIVHFFMDPPRSRKLLVKGIYETNLTEYFDDKVIIGDINLIRRLNDWGENIAGGLEVFVSDLEQLDEAGELIRASVEYDQGVENVRDKYIQVFEWLDLISRQVNILLTIILIVVCVNMVSIVIILIMERTTMIGTLKALGSADRLIRRIFTYSGIRLVGFGLIIGNMLGIGLCVLQYYFRWIQLNPQDYYISYVPIGWNWDIILLLNLLTFLVVSLVLILPTMIISGIKPIQAIRFD